MVNISGKGHHDGGSDALLQQAAQLTLGVDLSSESGHAEIVLGTDGGDALFLQATTHQTTGRGDETEAQINTGLDLVRQLSPVRGIDGSHSSLQLSSGDPVSGLVSSAVGDGTFGALSQSGALPEGFHSESELGGDGLKVASDVDTSHAAFKERGVEHLERCAEVIASILVFELGHVLATGRDGQLRLGNQLVGPSVVEAAGERALVVNVALAEDLELSLELVIKPTLDLCADSNALLLTLPVPYMAAKVYGLMRSPIANW